MRKFILLIVIVLSGLKVYSQCNLRTNNRPDGKTINYTSPQLISKNDKLELGTSIQTDGENYYLGTVVRFVNLKADKSIGNLILRFSNSSSSSLKLVEARLTYSKGSDVGIVLYKLEPSDIKLIKQNSITGINFKTQGGQLHIFKVLGNNQLIPRKQFQCLTN